MRSLAFSTWPVAAALFLLYTNWPVVAAQRGIVPQGLAVTIPLLLAAAATHQLVVRRRPLVVDRTFLLLLGFLLVLLLSTIRAADYDIAFARIGVFASEGLVIYLLIRNAIRTQADLRVAILAVIGAGGLLAGLTVFQMATDNYDQEFMGLAPRTLEHLEGLPPSARAEVGLEDRARGPVDEPNRFAQILLMAAGLGVIVAMNALRKTSALVAWGVVGLLMAGVLLTYSRGAMVTIVVLLILAVPMRLIRLRHLVPIAVGGTIAIVTLVPGFTDRVATMAGVAGLFGHSSVEPDGATTGRTTEMLAAFAAYLDHPVLGVGPGQYAAVHSVTYQALPEVGFRELAVPRRAHSLYFELAADYGTVGLLVFMAIPLLLLLDLGRLRRALMPRRPDLARVAAGFSLALLAYLGTGVFLHLAYERYYWCMIALAAAAVGILREWIRDDEALTSTYDEWSWSESPSYADELVTTTRPTSGAWSPTHQGG